MLPSPLSVQAAILVFQDTLMAGTKNEDATTVQSGRMQGEVEEEVEEEDTIRTEKLERNPAVNMRQKLFIIEI